MSGSPASAEPAVRPSAPRDVLRLALGFGAVTGLIELGLLVARVMLFENGVFLRSPHFLWMVPVSDLFLFATAGLLLAPLAAFWPRTARWLAAAGFAFLAGLSVLLLVRGLHAVAAGLLAGGIALNLASALAARWAGLQRAVRRAGPWLIGVLAVLVAVPFVTAAVARRQALAGRPPAPSTAPNVLLVVLDTVRADRLSLQGYHRPTTPNLTSLAAGGVRFRNAYTTAPWTLPAHASLFTGQWPHDLHTERLGKLDETYPTLAEFLRERGYATVGIVANQFFCGRESGLARGFDEYQDFPVTPGEVLRASTVGWLTDRTLARARSALLARLRPDRPVAPPLDFQRKAAADVNAEFLNWLSGRDTRRPFFAFLNYFDAHDPYLVPPGSARPHFGRVPRTRDELATLRDWQKVTQGTVRPEDVQLASDAYDDCIAYLDDSLGALFAALERRGLLKDTLVMIVSDHGEEFGEHGLFRHAVSLYETEVHVPLVVFGPGVSPIRPVVDEPVSLRDVPATVADLLGFANLSPFPGESLARFWTAAEPVPADPPLFEMVPTFEPHRSTIELTGAHNAARGIVADGLAYIQADDGSEELYDLDNDPGQSRNLAGAPEWESQLIRLRRFLGQLLDRAAAGRGGMERGSGQKASGGRQPPVS